MSDDEADVPTESDVPARQARRIRRQTDDEMAATMEKITAFSSDALKDRWRAERLPPGVLAPPPRYELEVAPNPTFQVIDELQETNGHLAEMVDVARKEAADSRRSTGHALLAAWAGVVVAVASVVLALLVR